MNRGTKKILLTAVPVLLLCISVLFAKAQITGLPAVSFTLTVHHKDTVNNAPALQSSFPGMKQAYDYVNGIPQMLAAKGFPVVSVDSVWQTENNIHIILYTGTKYNWISLQPKNIDREALSKSGFAKSNFDSKVFNIVEVNRVKENLLRYYANNGYPFAAISLDSISISDDKINALLVVSKSEFYHVDSVVNAGRLKLNKKFIQSYLGIGNNSIYNADKLSDVDRKLQELPYVDVIQPSSLSMLGSGSVLNLYLNPKRSSQVSAILGLLPDANNTGKFQLTGDVNLDLKNVFGAGEGLLFRYQALQPKSPRLNLGYDKPYILHSPFGLSFLFDLFKKDSSFLNLSAQAGLQLNLNANQIGKVLVQWQTTNLLLGGFDTNVIKLTKQLPENIDVRAVNAGITYEYIKTNYRYNPRSGNEVNVTALAGIKNIQKNLSLIHI